MGNIQNSVLSAIGNTERAIGVYKYFQNMEYEALGSRISNTAKNLNTTAGDMRSIASYHESDANEVEKQKIIRDAKTGRFQSGPKAAAQMRSNMVAPYIATAQQAENAARALGTTIEGLEASRGGSIFARAKALKVAGNKVSAAQESNAIKTAQATRDTLNKLELAESLKNKMEEHR